MLKQQARLIAAAVFLLDLALISAAFFLAHALRDELLPALGLSGLERGLYPVETYLPLLPLALAIWTVLLWSSGRYRSHRTVPLLEEAGAIVRVATSAAVVFALTVWAFRLDERLLGSDRISRAWIGLFAILAGLAILAEKLALRVTSRQVRARGFNFRTVLIVGTNAPARALAESIRGHRYWGYRVLGFVTNPEAGGPAEPGAGPVLGTLEELPRVLAGNVVDEVIFSVSPRELERFEDLVLALQEQGILTRFALDFFPHTQASMRLEEVDGVPLVTFSTSPTGALSLAFKRLTDVALSALLLLLAAPIVLAVALGIKLTSGGAVLFRQTRCGLNGRRFTLYKFRTMVVDAEERRQEVAHLNEMDGPVFKVRNDPRVTWLGRFLRKFSLDELPQLWNVLRGDMSLVGPRPPIPEEVAQYQRWQRRRLAMRPGLTCLWQISGRNQLDFDQWMRLDLQYIDSWSPWLDFKILAKTLPVVLSGRGAS
jgi:exopolysaccharide biosynthesis polyprenyl glycosylphosphotransferase